MPPTSPPVSGSRVIFNNLSTGNLSNLLGANYTLNQVRVVNPTGDVTIGSLFFGLTLNPFASYGNTTIDMSSATRNLTINPSSGLTIGSGSQNWNIATGRTLDIGTNMSGSGNITINGSGTSRVIMSGTNNSSFSGTITLAGGGTLQVNNANSLGTSATATTIGSGTTLEISQNSTYTVAEAINLNGGRILNTGATGTNSHTLTGAIVLGAGGNSVIQNTTDGALNLNGTAMSGAGSSLTFNGTGVINVNRVLNIGDTDVIKDGTNTVNLNAANPYTGDTTISAGTLALGASGTISNSPLITIASGATLAKTGTFALNNGQELTGNGSVTTSTGFTAAGGSVVSPGIGGSGTLGITGNTTFSGTGGGGRQYVNLTSFTSASIQLAVTGNLTYQSGAKMTLDGGGTLGYGTYSVVIGTSTGSLSHGFTSADFTLSNFAPSFVLTNFLGLSQSGTNVVLNFQVVPEHSTVLAIGAAGLGVAGYLRRLRVPEPTLSA